MKPLLACEVPLDKVNFPIYVSTKYDGCFTWGTKVWTEKGLIPIGKIVDEKLNIKVASYNETSKTIEFKKITNWFNNGLKTSENWHSFGRHLITGNHKVFSKGDWVSAEEYENGGIFVNPKVESFITGMLLGDSVGAIDKRYSLTWRLMWSNSINDESYGDAKMEMMRNLFGGRDISKKYKTSGYGKPIVYYTTPACTNLPYDISNFYVTDKGDENYGKRKEDLTLEDLDSFDELSLAIWFFDDGSLSYNNGNKQTPRLTFSVPRYSDNTHEVFKKLFKNKFNIQPTIHKHGKDVSMVFNTPDSWYLLALIAKVAGSMCARKIPDIFNVSRIGNLDMFTENRNLIGKRLPPSKTKRFVAYDIEVEGNHNYFANGMLVHNCRALVIDSVVYSRSLKPIRNKHVQQLFGKPEYNGFDGELVVGDVYAKDVFQKTTSGVMSEDGEPDVTFHVFDLWNMPDEDYEYRQRILQDLILQDSTPSDVVYTTIHKCHNVEDLEFFLKHEEKVGGEGLIGRNPKGRYKYGRSTPKEQFSMKFKFFQQEEFEVVGFTERMHNSNEQKRDNLGYSERSSSKDGMIPMNTLGSLVLKYGDTTFNVGTGFTDALRDEIWFNQEKYLGKLASIRYMSVGLVEKPRIPSWLGWRDEDDL